jgi:hypothetical protein
VASVIRVNLGEKTYLSIEGRLKERWDITVVDAIQDFNKLDATLREFFAAGADAIEKDMLQKIISLHSSKKGASLLAIENSELAKIILETYGNTEKRKLINAAYKKPAPILDILETCDIPKSTGYRLIGELISDGFLTESGFATTSDGKRVSKYTALFSQIKIDINLDDVNVHVLLKDEVLKESNLVKILEGKF